MTYSIKRVRDVKLDFYCRPSLTWVKGESGVWGTLDVSVGCRPQGRGKVEGNPVMVMDLSIEIVLPPNTSGANITTSAGKVLFDQEEKRIVWVLGNLRKEDIPTMKGPVYLKPGSMVPSRGARSVRCRIFHCGESRLYAAGGKSLRTGSGESECTSYEGRLQHDIDVDEAAAEWNIRYSDVILRCLLIILFCLFEIVIVFDPFALCSFLQITSSWSLLLICRPSQMLNKQIRLQLHSNPINKSAELIKYE